MQCQRQTKRSTSLLPWENKVKQSHEGQYLPSYRCWKELRWLPGVTGDDVKAGNVTSYGSLVALMTTLVTHRLPVSPLAHRRRRHVRHPCYVATCNSCDPSVRSERRWSPEHSPLLEGQPTRWPLLAHNKALEMSVRIEIWENPSIYFPSRVPTVTFWCAADLLPCSSSCSVGRCQLALSLPGHPYA